MTDWKFELAEAGLVAVTSELLIFFPSPVIFALALILCVCRSMLRKTPELQIQTHWLILAAAAGFFAFQISALAIIFLAAYSAVRFSISLIRYGEARELLHETENLRKIHESELKCLRRDSESRLNNTIGELKLQHLRENFNLRAEFQEKLMRKKNEPPKISDDP